MSESSRPFAEGPGLTVIRTSTLRMWLLSAMGKGGGQLVQLVALMVLARVLVPEDFGIIAMAMVLIGVADVFREFGLSAATVRSPDLTAEQASTMFVVNAMLGVVMAIFVYCAAPLATFLYRDADVVPVIQWLSWAFLFNGLGAQHQALLRRKLKFGVLAWINLLVVVMSQCLAVFLALKGFGYWALVVAALTASVLRCLAVWIANPWLPRKPVLDGKTRSMLSFGGYLAMFGFIGFIANHSHSLIIGERFGPAEVGFYNRAFVILTLALSYIMAPLATVVPPTLSRVLNDQAEYRALYLHYLGMMLGMTVPIGFFLTLTAGDVIALVLGEQWTSSVLILQILALSVIPRTISSSSGWLYQSHGDSKRMMQWGVGGWSSLLLMLLVGAQYGIKGVAIAYSVGMYLLVYPCMVLAFRKTQLHFRDLIPVVFPIIGAGLLALPLTILLWMALEELAPIWRLLGIIPLYSASYLWLLMTLFGKKDIVMELLVQLRPTGFKRKSEMPGLELGKN